MDDNEIQRRFRDLAREISRLKKKASVAREKQVAAEARSHEMKLRAKSAELGLRGLQQDALRYRWLRENWDHVTGFTWRGSGAEGLDHFVDVSAGINGARRRLSTAVNDGDSVRGERAPHDRRRPRHLTFKQSQQGHSE